MTNKWRTATVEELETEGILLVQDGNHGEYRPRNEEFCAGGTAFIRAADLDQARVRFESASSINRVALARIRKGIGQPGDVLFSHKGTVGKLALVQSDAPTFVCSPQTTFWRSLRPDVLNRCYLYYFMQSAQFREQWEARKGETDMADYVSLTAQRALRVTLPPIDEQRTIAVVLGALDDKIDLNRQVNHTLEEMSSALFGSWFTDYGPVVARADGRRPIGMEPGMAALFPTALADGLPSGWRWGCVGDMIELQRGFDLPESARTLGTVPVIAAGGFHGFHNKAMAKGPGVVTGRSGKIGDVYWVDSDYWPLNTTLWVKQLSVGVGPLFAYHLLKSLDLAALNVGSAVPSLNRNHVHPIPAVVPSEDALAAFESLVRRWFELRGLNDSESRTLATLRDALLPKLLSGDIRLPEADRTVEAAL